jgi:hypothetical protein
MIVQRLTMFGLVAPLVALSVFACGESDKSLAVASCERQKATEAIAKIIGSQDPRVTYATNFPERLKEGEWCADKDIRVRLMDEFPAKKQSFYNVYCGDTARLNLRFVYMNSEKTFWQITPFEQAPSGTPPAVACK